MPGRVEKRVRKGGLDVPRSVVRQSCRVLRIILQLGTKTWNYDNKFAYAAPRTAPALRSRLWAAAHRFCERRIG